MFLIPGIATLGMEEAPFASVGYFLFTAQA
jgi:hypothetical protein